MEQVKPENGDTERVCSECIQLTEENTDMGDQMINELSIHSLPGFIIEQTENGVILTHETAFSLYRKDSRLIARKKWLDMSLDFGSARLRNHNGIIKRYENPYKDEVFMETLKEKGQIIVSEDATNETKGFISRLSGSYRIKYLFPDELKSVTSGNIIQLDMIKLCSKSEAELVELIPEYARDKELAEKWGAAGFNEMRERILKDVDLLIEENFLPKYQKWHITGESVKILFLNLNGDKDEPKTFEFHNRTDGRIQFQSGSFYQGTIYIEKGDQVNYGDLKRESDEKLVLLKEKETQLLERMRSCALVVKK